MNTGLLLLLVLVLLLAGTLAAARPQDAAALPPRLVDVQRVTARWRTGGLIVGVVVSLASTQVGTLGRGLMLAGPLLAVCVLLGVVLGELRVTAPPAAERRAVLEVRRVRDYVPRRLSAAVVASAALLTGLLVTTTAMASTDDLGREGRQLFRQCSEVHSEGHGPWPGSFYSVPLAVVVGLGLLVAGLALRQVVRRPRQGSDLAADDSLRRRAAETVTASTGLLVAVPFAGVALIAGIGLSSISCAPASWTALSTSLLLLVPLQLGLVAWCAGLLLGRRPVPAVPSR